MNFASKAIILAYWASALLGIFIGRPSIGFALIPIWICALLYVNRKRTETRPPTPPNVLDFKDFKKNKENKNGKEN